MADASPPRRRTRRAPPVTLETAPQSASPADFADPFVRTEIKRAAVWIGMIVLVGLAIYQAQALLVIFGGVVFAAMIDGGARLLGRILHIGRGWRVTIVLLLALAFIVWLFMFAGSQIAEQAAQLPAVIEVQTGRVLTWLAGHGFKVDVSSVQGLLEKAIGGIGQLTSALGGVLGGLTTAFLIAVLGIYFAVEPDLYRRGLSWLLPAGERSRFADIAQTMGKTLRRLLFGRLIGMAVEGVATWVMLAVYGVPMSALLGLLTGLLAFLPNIGAPISGLLMVMVGFSGGTEMGIYCIIVYVVVQTVDGNVIVPMIAKKTADLAPALVLGAQLIMGALFGILGLALADPLVAMIKILLEERSQRNADAAT
ncbi:AI-2E family transporter [Novosphingobium sp.]|uniref:AI-2E family transporter n=1 Tax=Novosphingobium sp. TaxID=1874826 RepID=UPI0025F0A9C0|nr:AI-2E family transporter [Novosphingobium sp.]